MSDRRFANFAWGVLGYSLLVILWGYFLRISESGDGCGTDWPLCEGAVLPGTTEFPTWVEYIHRVSSGVVLLLTVAMVVGSRRRFPAGHAVRFAAGAALLLTLTESLFGAVLVVFGWVAQDISTARIAIRPFHVLNTFTLMAALALTAWWAERGVERRPSFGFAEDRRWPLALGGILLLATTGSWTGLAGTAFAPESVGAGMSQYLDPEHLLIYLRVAHPLLALGVILGIGRLAWVHRERAEAPIEKRLALAVIALAALQLLLGPGTILLLYPTELRLLHLFAADLLWIALLFLASEARTVIPARSSSLPPTSGRSRPGAARP